MANPKTCETCQSWHRKVLSSRAEDFPVGECRCGPPPRDFKWSMTKSNDGCDQHKAREKKKVAA